MSLQEEFVIKRNCIQTDNFFRKQGFTCREENTTDPTRLNDYEMEFRRDDSNVMFRLVIRFELSISDGPFGSYTDNHNLYYCKTFLEIFHRGLDITRSDYDYYYYYGPEETDEKLEWIARYELNVNSYKEIKALIARLSK